MQVRIVVAVAFLLNLLSIPTTSRLWLLLLIATKGGTVVVVASPAIVHHSPTSAIRCLPVPECGPRLLVRRWNGHCDIVLVIIIRFLLFVLNLRSFIGTDRVTFCLSIAPPLLLRRRLVVVVGPLWQWHCLLGVVVVRLLIGVDLW